ncbi:hypothetical protein EVAR_11976_1 [Eumeta japonica]|uniref:Uncharacterized protein n=1 Tax=Eumeta variegata TaxID=151549 RepID=A0A4C1U5I4_EUMVA|nr:hypothetical protein EVAR_11976_1 [Eumeta japonica]
MFQTRAFPKRVTRLTTPTTGPTAAVTGIARDGCATGATRGSASRTGRRRAGRGARPLLLCAVPGAVAPRARHFARCWPRSARCCWRPRARLARRSDPPDRARAYSECAQREFDDLRGAREGRALRPAPPAARGRPQARRCPYRVTVRSAIESPSHDDVDTKRRSYKGFSLF